jgi:glutathione S-transferase
MEMLEAELAKGNAFIAGDSFSVADIALGLSIHRWFIVPFERKSLPHVTAYYERLKQRPAGARWMPDDIV